MRVNYKYSITKSIYSSLGHVVAVARVDCGRDDDGGARAHHLQVVRLRLRRCAQAVWPPHRAGGLCAPLIVA